MILSFGGYIFILFIIMFGKFMVDNNFKYVISKIDHN